MPPPFLTFSHQDNRNWTPELKRALAKEKAQVFYPAPMFCTDNGAMIAYTGCQRLMAGQQEASRIRNAGLPTVLADRLYLGV